MSVALVSLTAHSEQGLRYTFWSLGKIRIPPPASLTCLTPLHVVSWISLASAAANVDLYLLFLFSSLRYYGVAFWKASVF